MENEIYARMEALRFILELELRDRRPEQLVSDAKIIEAYLLGKTDENDAD